MMPRKKRKSYAGGHENGCRTGVSEQMTELEVYRITQQNRDDIYRNDPMPMENTGPKEDDGTDGPDLLRTR